MNPQRVLPGGWGGGGRTPAFQTVWCRGEGLTTPPRQTELPALVAMATKVYWEMTQLLWDKIFFLLMGDAVSGLLLCPPPSAQPHPETDCRRCTSERQLFVKDGKRKKNSLLGTNDVIAYVGRAELCLQPQMGHWCCLRESSVSRFNGRPRRRVLPLTMLEGSAGSLMEICAATCATGESRFQTSN